MQIVALMHGTCLTTRGEGAPAPHSLSRNNDPLALSQMRMEIFMAQHTAGVANGDGVIYKLTPALGGH
jgi:hypothetical protein